MNKTYYSVLEIRETATQDEIKSAFRTLVKKYHPDNIETGDEKKFKKENSTTPDSKGTASQTTGKTNSYSQYASYTKTREESEYDLDELMKYILKTYRQKQQYDFKENFIHLNKSYYNYLKHFQSNQEYEEKEENITLKKTLRR